MEVVERSVSTRGLDSRSGGHCEDCRAKVEGDKECEGEGEDEERRTNSKSSTMWSMIEALWCRLASA